MSEGFVFKNADAAMKFYEACERAGAVTLKERMAVMRQMVKEKQVKYLRDAEAFVKGKKVLKIVPKRENPSA